jgi:ABC-type transporter MlaC component
MKNVFIFLTLILFGTNSFAQDDEFNKMMREMYKDTFIDVVNENMNLSEADDAKFQPVFSEFLNQLGTIMDNKLIAQKKFADYFEGMTDEQASTLLADVFANRKAYDKLLYKYEKKIAKEIGHQSAFRFFLIVEKVNANFYFSTIQNLPLVKN